MNRLIEIRPSAAPNPFSPLGPRFEGAAVRLLGVSKAFGSFQAVSHLDLEVPRGEIFGLLGPNGSGKTTTIRMMLGILVPDRGTVQLLDGRPVEWLRQRVGYLPEERGLYRKMKVQEHLLFFARLKGVSRKEAQRRGAEWLARLGLEEVGHRRVEDLSKGMQQKVQFIGTVLHQPDLLILDEPFSGLDPLNQDVLESIILELRRSGTTVLLSTHRMEQAERLCDRVCLLSHSRKVLEGAPKDLKRAERAGIVAVDFEGPTDWLDSAGAEWVELHRHGVRVRLGPETSSGAFLARALASGVHISRFEEEEPTLHEIFIRHVRVEDR
jgi:ABC-2 type transport system ATP-binding protein